MAQRSKPDGMSFGLKVKRLLDQNEDEGRSPSNAVELADIVGCDVGAIYKWRKRGSQPLASTGRKVADALGVDYAWLSDPTRGWADKDTPPSLAAVLSAIHEVEHPALARILANPVERRAWVAAWTARYSRP